MQRRQLADRAVRAGSMLGGWLLGGSRPLRGRALGVPGAPRVAAGRSFADGSFATPPFARGRVARPFADGFFGTPPFAGGRVARSFAARSSVHERFIRRALVCVVVLLGVVGCMGLPRVGDPPRVERLDPDRLRIASFDFPESRVLAEVYGQRLRRAGFAVDVLAGLGAREVVHPALEQGLVDIVVDYTGSLLDYLGGSALDTHRPPEKVHAAVERRLAARGLTALRPAPAEDTNGFAVRAAFARENQLSTLSDLRPLAGQLVFGGPPECRTRRYCLPGLQETYGLRFADFRPQPSRAATETALETGEIDVGMLETTYGGLGEQRVMLLVDNLSLQPQENVVPVVRTEIVRRYGNRLTDALDSLSERLTTPALVRLNRAEAVDPIGASAVATRYLDLLDR
jgi:osmoprotectant transport system substrate-binding protein